jgi:DNA-binding HxlR family transcriptional regulator
MTRGYQQFCGLARALDLVGGRWALLVVRDLLSGPKRFSELHEGLPGIPTNVLTTRLRELEDAGIVQRRLDSHPRRGVFYELTEYGRELEQPVLRLGFWGAKSLGPREEGEFVSLDSLAIALRGAFHPDQAEGPPRLYELRTDGKSLRIGVDRGQVTVPSESPNEPDLLVEAEPDVLSQLLAGAVDVGETKRSGQLRVHGTLAEARRMFRMFRFPSTQPA